MYSFSFEIMGLPKMINELNYAHWAVKRNETKKWRRASHLKALSGRPPKPLEKAKITYTRFSSRQPDMDNLGISFKAIQDGLKDAGIIIDDNQDVIEVSYVWAKTSPRLGRVKIEIQSI